MRAHRPLVVLIFALTVAGCASSSRHAAASPPPSARPSSSAAPSPLPSPSATPCPWNLHHRKPASYTAYDHTLRVTLDNSCLLGVATGGRVFYGPDAEATGIAVIRYDNGTEVTVDCVNDHGESVTDDSGTTSATWLRVFITTELIRTPLKVYVPYAAVGYADTHHLGECRGTP